jgi:hypothetical protein
MTSFSVNDMAQIDKKLDRGLTQSAARNRG